jgi:glycosyltransferase involved in cell wall biosynthesis
VEGAGVVESLAPSAHQQSTAARPDLIVLSHLPWTWVWQRPQHLVSRLSRGRRTWFVEQPLRADVAAPTLRRADVGGIHRVWLEMPRDTPGDQSGQIDFEPYADLLVPLLGEATSGSDVWLYTPNALSFAESLAPRLLVYDVMDDLAAFADGGDHLRLLQHRALHRADLAFAGGHSLYRVAAQVRGPAGVHLVPSGVETAHYAASRSLRRPRVRPAAGYVGVIDERLDLALVAELAAELPHWDIRLVGPVTKIDPAVLPQAPNLVYPGMQPYERLPQVMAGLDVALMPFALNEATRAISPTKTLEYLAAGLPVVSTRVPDVVTGWSTVVRFADDGAGFAEGCLAVRDDDPIRRDALVEPLRVPLEWDTIAAEMDRLMRDTLVGSAASAARSVAASA